MENERSKFKKEFKERVYHFILVLIKFIDRLPVGRTCDVIGKQLLRSGITIQEPVARIQEPE